MAYLVLISTWDSGLGANVHMTTFIYFLSPVDRNVMAMEIGMALTIDIMLTIITFNCYPLAQFQALILYSAISIVVSRIVGLKFQPVYQKY